MDNQPTTKLDQNQYLALLSGLQFAKDTKQFMAKADYNNAELCWTLSNSDTAPYVGGVKDIAEYAETFDPTIQNGKVVANDKNWYADYTKQELEQLDQDSASDDAYSRWDHLK